MKTRPVSSLSRAVLLAAAFLIPTALSHAAPANNALPTGGQVAAGQVGFATSGTAAAPTLNVTQGSDRAIVNWQAFNVGRDATVKFTQPSASSAILNRVVGSDPSQIFGQIQANGQVFLVNPQGIYFSPTSSVDVGSFVASTLSISDADFLAGRLNFRREGATGSIVNEGTIRSVLGGYVALLAPEVRNAGLILAQAGSVVLAAGEAVSFNFDPAAGVTGFLVEPAQVKALIENQRIVSAPGGQVIVSAQAYNGIASGVIRNTGTIEASAISHDGGHVFLGASDTVEQGGTVAASSASGKGGEVTVVAPTIALLDNSSLLADGELGGGQIHVGGGWQGSGALPQSHRVTFASTALIDASARGLGNGGEVVLWSDVHDATSLTQAAGEIRARGGELGGNGGRVETSGHFLDAGDARVDTRAPLGRTGDWLLDPVDITIADAAGSPSPGLNLNLGGGLNINNLGGGNNVSNLTPAQLVAGLQTSNVSLSTAGSGSATGVTPTYSAGNGDITINNAVTSTSTNTLTLTADRYINVNATLSTGGNINLTAGTRLQGSGGISIASGKTLNITQSGESEVQSQILLAASGETITDTSHLSSNTTYSGVISGDGSVTKAGAGTLTLTGTNTYTGGTTVSDGKLQLGNVDTNGSIAGDVAVSAGATLVFNRSDNLTFSGVISGAGSLTKTSASPGTLTLAGVNTYTGATAVNGGSIVFNNDTLPATSGFTGTGKVSFTPSGTSFVSAFNTGNYTFAPTLTGLTIGKSGNTEAITVSSAISIAGSIYMDGGDITVNGNVSSTNVSVNYVSVINTPGINIPGQNLNVNVPVISSEAIALKSSGVLTIASGTRIAATFRNVVLVAARFVNNAGSTALSAGASSTWNVWSTNADPFDASTGDVIGGLAFDYRQYNASYGNTNPLGTGNGMFYSYAPSVTPTLASAYSRIYNGATDANDACSYLTASAGLVGGDVSPAFEGSANFASKNVGTGITINFSGISIRRAQTSAATGSKPVYGYGVNAAGLTATGSITPLALTIIGLDNLSKVYDGSTSAPISGTTVRALGSDDVTLNSAGVTAAFGDKNVAADKAVTFTGTYSLSGADASNYTVIQPIGKTGFITPKPLTVSGLTVASKTYDGTTTATVSGTPALDRSGVISGDVVNLAGTGTVSFASKNAGTGIAVTIDTYNLTGADAGNYSVVAASSVTGTITPKALTITAPTIASKTYDGTTAAGAVTVGTLTGFVDNETVTASGSAAALGSKNVGNYTTTVSYTLVDGNNGGLSANYSLADSTGVSAAITAKQITVGGITAVNKTYDGTTAATFSGAPSLSDVLLNENVTLSGTAQGSFDTKNVGTAKTVTLSGYTLSGADAGNYTIVQPTTPFTADITPKALTVTGITGAQDKTYDGTTTATLVGTAVLDRSGVISGDVVNLAGTPTGVFASKNVGTGIAVTVDANSLTGADAGNYTVVAASGLTANITGDITPAVPPIVIVPGGNNQSPQGGNNQSSQGGVVISGSNTYVGTGYLPLTGNLPLTLGGSSILATAGSINAIAVSSFNYSGGTSNSLTFAPGVLSFRLPVIVLRGEDPSPQNGASTFSGSADAVLESRNIIARTIASGAYNQGPQSGPGALILQPPALTITIPKASTDVPATNAGVKLEISRTIVTQGADRALSVGQIFGIAAPKADTAVKQVSFQVVGFVPGQSVLEVGDQSGLNVSVDKGNIVITGNATAADYERVLRSVTLRPTGGGQPSQITIKATVTDGTGSSQTQTVELGGRVDKTGSDPVTGV